MNRKDLRSVVYLELGDPVEATVPPLLVDKYLNDGIKAYTFEVWPIREKLTVAVTLGLTTKDLAADYGGMTKWFSTDGTERIVLSLEQIQDAENDNIRNPSDESFVAQEGQTLYFYPAIAAGEVGNAEVTIGMDPPLLSDDSTALDENINDEAVTAYALWKAMRGKNPKAALLFKADYEELIHKGRERRSAVSATAGVVQPDMYYRTRGLS